MSQGTDLADKVTQSEASLPNTDATRRFTFDEASELFINHKKR